jgi:hypothetical protein
MEPMGAEIDAVALESDCHGAAADPVARLKHGDGEPRRDEPTGGGNAGGAGADHSHIDVAARQRREARCHNRAHEACAGEAGAGEPCGPPGPE